MAIGAGLAGQIGIVKESAVNTPVAVSTFTRLLSSSLAPNIHTAQDMGLSAGLLVPLGSRRVLTGVDGAGDVTFNIPSKGFGRWLQMAMGSTPTATQISTSGAYTQFHNIGSADGASYTIQTGNPERGGTVDPWTFGGCKCVGWELTADAGGLLQWKATIDAMSAAQTGAGALGIQTASYSADQNFGFNNVALNKFAAYTTVSSLLTPTSPVAPGAVIRKISLKGGQPKDTDAWTAGSTTKAEALGNDWLIPTGTVSIDYDATTLPTAYLANTSIGLQISATGAIVGTSGTNVATVQFTMPTCFLETPSAPDLSNGPGIITIDYNFSVLSDASSVSMQAYLISTDAAV